MVGAYGRGRRPSASVPPSPPPLLGLIEGEGGRCRRTLVVHSHYWPRGRRLRDRQMGERRKGGFYERTKNGRTIRCNCKTEIFSLRSSCLPRSFREPISHPLHFTHLFRSNTALPVCLHVPFFLHIWTVRQFNSFERRELQGSRSSEQRGQSRGRCGAKSREGDDWHDRPRPPAMPCRSVSECNDSDAAAKSQIYTACTWASAAAAVAAAYGVQRCKKAWMPLSIIAAAAAGQLESEYQNQFRG